MKIVKKGLMPNRRQVIDLGDIPGPQVVGETDRIMAFDVTRKFGELKTNVLDVTPNLCLALSYPLP